MHRFQSVLSATAFLATVLAVSAGAADAQSRARGNASPRPASDTATLLQLECALNRALLERDTATFKRLTAPEYTSVAPDGTTGDRTKDMASLASGTITITAIGAIGMRVRQYGNAAVLTGQNRLAGTVDGQAMSGTFQWTDTWVRRGGRWQMVASQLTGVASAPPSTTADQCASQ